MKRVNKRFAEDERIHERKVKRRTQKRKIKKTIKLGVKAERYHLKGVLICLAKLKL